MSCVCRLQFPDWSYLEDNSSYDNSWCDDRIFNLAFVLSGGLGVGRGLLWHCLDIGYGGNARLCCVAEQCPCFAAHLRPEVVTPLWPYSGTYGTALSKH